MRIKTKIFIALGALLLLTGATCEGKHNDFPDPDPGKGFTPRPNPDPSAMASAEQNPKFITMELHVRNHETGGVVKYTVHGGAEQTIKLESEKVEDGTWWVVWNLPVIAEPAKNYGFTWYPNGPGNYAQCTLYAQGIQQDYQHVQRGSCAVSYTSPKA